MNFPSFLTTLFENGCVQVPPAVPISPDEVYDAQQVLIEFEVEYRLTLADVPPAFDLQIGCEAALSLYRVCQCLVYRDLDLQQVLPEPASDNGAGNSAAVHYSTDVTLRFLPDAWRLARDASEKDPLVSFLLKTARRWPLSSVGIPGTSIGSIDGFADNPTLLALYVDRIIERRDKSRLDDARVREAILRAIGAHDELVPELTEVHPASASTIRAQ